jgi:hypothetical protein
VTVSSITFFSQMIILGLESPILVPVPNPMIYQDHLPGMNIEKNNKKYTYAQFSS